MLMARSMARWDDPSTIKLHVFTSFFLNSLYRNEGRYKYENVQR